jgi:hypothetical protein
MAISTIYIAISILTLAIIALLLFKVKPKKLSRLSSIAFVFILAGVVFGDSRLVGYSLMGIGVIISIVDMVLKLKK